MNRWPKFSKHHLVWRTERNKFNTNHPDNIQIIKHNIHQAIHTIFWEEHKPKEQVEIFVRILEPILWPISKDLFDTIFLLPDESFYKKWLIK